jgi:PUA domain protein
MIKQLSKADIKEFTSRNNLLSLINVGKNDRIELLDNNIYLINKEPLFFLMGDKIIPTLKLEMKNRVLKKVTVDMGAVKFVVNGADIMRPGILSIDKSIEENDIVVIEDVNNKKALAIGMALFNGAVMQEMSSGKVIKNLHYVGDDIWKIISNIK